MQGLVHNGNRQTIENMNSLKTNHYFHISLLSKKTKNCFPFFELLDLEVNADLSDM